MEIRFTVNEDFIEKLQKELGQATATEIARSALSLLNWAVTESKEGRVILSADKQGDPKFRLALPILDKVKTNEEVKQ